VAAGTEAVEAHRSKKVGKAAAAAADADEDEEEEEAEEEVGGAEAGVEGDEEPAAAQASLAFPLARMKRAIKEENTNMLVGAGATTSFSCSYINDHDVVANMLVVNVSQQRPQCTSLPRWVRVFRFTFLVRGGSLTIAFFLRLRSLEYCVGLVLRT
jgi:hypothetical protein